MNLAEQQIMINAKLSNQMITRNQNTRKVAIVVCTTTRRRTTRNVYHCYSYNYYVFFFFIYVIWFILCLSYISDSGRFFDCNELGWTWIAVVRSTESHSLQVDSALYDRYGLSWCGLTQIRPYHIFMRPTANPALYQMEKNN